MKQVIMDMSATFSGGTGDSSPPCRHLFSDGFLMEKRKMVHYVYRLTAQNPDGSERLYIGVRTCKGAYANDTAYLSSSKYVHEAIARGVVFNKVVLSTHLNRFAAAKEEIRLHDLHDVGRSPEYFNGAKQTSTGFDPTGCVRSPETRAKLSAANKGRKVPPVTAETRAKLSASHRTRTYRPHTLEARAKISAAQVGKKYPPVTAETRAKISAANIGKSHPQTPETRAKISAAHAGKKRPSLTPEHCANIAAANRGKKRSPEACANISAGLVGKKRSPPSPETRAKLAAALKGRKRPPEVVEKILATKQARHASKYSSNLSFDL